MNFDREFYSDGYLACAVWSQDPRVQFVIPNEVLDQVLGGDNPVHDDANVSLCMREHVRIEAACRWAFAVRPGKRVELQKDGFLAAG